MRKVINLLAILILGSAALTAQTHYVIAFDCTKSMDHPNAFEDGDYSASARDVFKVWEPAKSAVRDIFENAYNADRFTIILFQDKILDICDGQKSNLAWSDINTRMESAIRHPGNTCILSAWECAEQYLASSSAPSTVFYLITDGEEEHDTKAKTDEIARQHSDILCQKIKQFCATHSNTSGFYTNLVRSLHNNDVNRALDQSRCFKTIIAGRFDPMVVVEMGEDKRNQSQTISIIFHPEDRDRLAVTIDNIEIHPSTEFFTITPTSGRIHDNKFDVVIKPDKSIPLDLIEKGSYTFPATLKSNHSAKHVIYEQDIEFVVNFKKSRVAFLPTNEMVGKSTYQKPFSLLKNISPTLAAEKGPSIIRFNLDSIIRKEYGQPGLFNDEAIQQGAEIQLRLVKKNAKPAPHVTMLYNGKKCNNFTATIKSSDSQHIIDFIFDKTAKSKKYNNLGIEVVNGSAYNLDRVNTNTACQYSNDLELIFEVKSNPWYVGAIWIVVFLVLVLLLWIIIANFPTRKMIGQLMPEGLSNALLQGKVRFVMTNKVRKQNLLSRLFFGHTGFSEPDNFWSSDLIIKKGRKINIILIMPSDKYQIDGDVRTVPYLVIKGTEFTIKNIEQDKTITIIY